MAKPIPDGFHSVTPQITVRGADRALEFYKAAFGAVEVARFSGPGGQGIMHAEIRIGDSTIIVGDELPMMGSRSPQSLGGVTGTIYLYVDDVDAVYARAIAAGATAKLPVRDMFWGDRTGRVIDPFGHEWAIATHKEEVSIEEMRKRSEVFFAN